jgi:hypothetical protein
MTVQTVEINKYLKNVFKTVASWPVWGSSLSTHSWGNLLQSEPILLQQECLAIQSRCNKKSKKSANILSWE